MGMNGRETFNINGDTAAGTVQQGGSALLLTDVSGVKNAAGDVLTEANDRTNRGNDC
jgi:acetylglutamate kinase